MKILFLHGLEGSPEGQKPTWLRAAGHEVVAPVLDTRELIAHLEGWISAGKPDTALTRPSTWASPLASATAALSSSSSTTAPFDVVVGSSFGGGLALELVRLGLWTGPVVALAPAATKIFGITSVGTKRLAILHGRHDSVVPVGDSIALAAAASGDVTLRLVDDDHRLSASVAAGLMGELLQLVVVNTG